MKLTIESIFTTQGSEALCSGIAGQNDRGRIIGRLALLALGGAVLYGFTMGLRHSFLQAFTSAGKVYLLFVATLAVCLPTLHFIGLLFGSRINFAQTLSILMAGVARTCVMLGAFAPISLFFLLSGSRYEFLMLMHVAIFACCGAVGLLAVWRHMEVVRAFVCPDENDERTTWLLRIWFVLYMFIGAQMSYLLSPFVGTDSNYILITSHKGDFFSYLLGLLRDWMAN